MDVYDNDVDNDNDNVNGSDRDNDNDDDDDRREIGIGSNPITSCPVFIHQTHPTVLYSSPHSQLYLYISTSIVFMLSLHVCIHICIQAHPVSTMSPLRVHRRRRFNGTDLLHIEFPICIVPTPPAVQHFLLDRLCVL